MRNPIIVALDMATAEEALKLVEQLVTVSGGFKVGIELFTSAGPEIVRRIRALAMALAALLVVAASFSAMNTMYAAVSHRTREVATLLALGFSPRRVQLCFVAESLVMALAGGLGGSLGALALGGFSTAVMNLRSFSEVMFQVRVDAMSVGGGLVFAAVIGVLGGFLPARLAARMEITSTLRQA